MRLLSVVMIVGLVLGGGSVYLSKVAFADDPWSQIEQRELVAQKTAALVYSDKYLYNDVNGSQRNWSGLSYSTTDENTKGRDIPAASQASLQNAMSGFSPYYEQQLSSSQLTNYTGLNSTTTDEQGRDRNALIAEGRSVSLNDSQSIVSALARIDEAYTNLQDNGTTNEQSPDREAQIEKTREAMEIQATSLVNDLARIDTGYLNLQYNGTTNENTQGRQLTTDEASSLNKAIQIFQEIHAKALAATYSTNYVGLNSTTTNEHNTDDRNMQIETGTEVALQNALNIYNAYYNGAGLNQTTYSH